MSADDVEAPAEQLPEPGGPALLHLVQAVADMQAAMTGALQALAHRIVPLMQQVTRDQFVLSETAAALEQAADQIKPARPTDRPAWQSPYGPPRRNR